MLLRHQVELSLRDEDAVFDLRAAGVHRRTQPTRRCARGRSCGVPARRLTACCGELFIGHQTCCAAVAMLADAKILMRSAPCAFRCRTSERSDSGDPAEADSVR